MPSEVVALSSFGDRLMLWFRKCGGVSEGESDVEIALREASQTRSFTEIMRIPESRSMSVAAVNLRKSQIAVKNEDEDLTFTRWRILQPPENIGCVYGRGIWVMKALMDEVRFEEGGVVVHMRKSTGQAAKRCTEEPTGIG